MQIGVVREIKAAERRVALTPAGALELVRAGHAVTVEQDAGAASGFPDEAYVKAGAQIEPESAAIWAQSELLLKVKEPIAPEFPHMREDLVLFAYLHLAPDPTLTEALVSSGITAIAYETVEDERGGLPLLAPMSEIAGRLATQAGAYYLQSPYGGNGTLIGGAPGVAPARVLVIGGGAVGTHAARVAVGMGADVTILERSIPRIRELEELFSGRARVLMSDAYTLSDELRVADLVVGAVLIPGARAPKLISRDDVRSMREGSVITDVAIDQGGCVETSRPTTHESPTYVVDGVVHYCVANMPGAVPATSTRALTNATLPYVQALAGGVDEALDRDPFLARGLNVREGEITYGPVADAYDAHVAVAAA
jgi:alanine dehydrogenase